MNQNQNVFQNQNGVNTKRMISSKMYSSKGKNGKEEVVVDILSGITKNKKSRGLLIKDFLADNINPYQYIEFLEKTKNEFTEIHL